jgi:hypothetical protein
LQLGNGGFRGLGFADRKMEGEENYQKLSKVK